MTSISIAVFRRRLRGEDHTWISVLKHDLAGLHHPKYIIQYADLTYDGDDIILTAGIHTGRIPLRRVCILSNILL